MPVFVAAGILSILFYFNRTPEDTVSVYLGNYLFLLVLGYVSVGVPSILYSIVMEFIVNPMCSNHITVVLISITVVLISIVLGLVSDATFVAPWLYGGIEYYLAIIGVVPGFITGVYLRWSYVKAANKRLQSDATTPHLK